MERARISGDGELEKALEGYVRRQKARRGAAAPAQPLRISPAREGSGKRDVSLRHDEYFAADA